MRYQAINNLYSNVSTQVNDKAYDDKGKLVEIDEDKVVEEVKRLQADYDALQYQRDRKYPALGEQLDLLFHDMTAGKGDKTGKWYKAVNKVKTDHPKPE